MTAFFPSAMLNVALQMTPRKGTSGMRSAAPIDGSCHLPRPSCSKNSKVKQGFLTHNVAP